MTIKRVLAAALAATIAISGLTVSLSGCKKDETESDDDDDKKKKKDDDEEAKPAETAEEAPATGDVQRYPDMVRAGGTYILKKTFHVYQAADLASTKITSLAPGTLVNFLYRHGGWIMVDWPSGPGQLSPGWIHEQWNSPNLKKQDLPDAGKTVEVDAGKVEEPPDAGKVEETKDAGPKIRPKLRIPGLKK